MVITPHQFFEERALKKYFNIRGPHTSWYNYWYFQGSKDHKGDFATHRSSFYQSCCYYLKSQSLAWKRSWIGLELKNGSKLDATAKVLCQSCVNPNAIQGCHRPKWPIQKKFNFMSQLLACIHKFNIFCHLSTLRLTLLQFVRPSRIGFRSGFCNGSQPY